MSIAVRWFPTLIKRSRSGQAETRVDWTDGLTPLVILAAEGFNRTDAEAIMAIVNDSQVPLEHPLVEGDSLEFLVSIQGG